MLTGIVIPLFYLERARCVSLILALLLFIYINSVLIIYINNAKMCFLENNRPHRMPGQL